MGNARIGVRIHSFIHSFQPKVAAEVPKATLSLVQQPAY
jgi:hypothetical protein